MDKSTDQTDIASMAIFVPEVDHNFDIVKELLSIDLLKGCATGEDIVKVLKKVMEFNDLSF